jgi:hypothetical protein
MSTWKSKLLDKLGVVSVAGVDHGPSGLAKGLLLAATVVAGLGCVSTANANENAGHEGLGQTYAQKQQHMVKEGPTGLAKVYDTVVHADSFLLNKALDQVIDFDKFQPQEGSIPENLDETKSPLMHVTGIAMSGVAATAAAPAMGAWIMVKQVDNTIQFVKDSQEANVNATMAGVEDRTQRIYRETLMASRTEDLKKQGIENPTEDQLLAIDDNRQQMRRELKDAENQRESLRIMDEFDKSMGITRTEDPDLEIKGSTVSAAAFESEDIPASTGGIGDLLNKGKKVERDHGSELSR